jgi:hypothetical protein
VPISKDACEELPDEAMDRLYSPDGYHYLLFNQDCDLPPLKKLLEIMFQEDRDLFLSLYANTGASPPAEIEQQALRWRNNRLADRGWPDIEEAVQLYHPRHMDKTIPNLASDLIFDNPPRYPLERMEQEKLLISGIEFLENSQKLDAIRGQLANLVNRVIVADGLPPTEIESLQKASQRVQGFLEIGLFTAGAANPESVANLLNKVPLLWLFQSALAQIHLRVVRAKKLGTTLTKKLLEMMPAEFSDRFKALCLHRPLFLPAGESIPREFQDPDDLRLIDSDLDLIQASAQLCSDLDLTTKALPDPFPEGCFPNSPEGLNLWSLLLTIFCNYTLDHVNRVAPIRLDRLPDLFLVLSSSPPLDQRITQWMEGSSPKTLSVNKRLVEILGHSLQHQILIHHPEKIDPRFIEGLWIVV